MSQTNYTSEMMHMDIPNVILIDFQQVRLVDDPRQQGRRPPPCGVERIEGRELRVETPNG